MAQKVRTYNPRIAVICKCGEKCMQSSMQLWTYFCLDNDCRATYVLEVTEE